MRTIVTACLALLTPLVVVADVSGDPTVAAAPSYWCNPNTPVYSIPVALTRQSYGALTIGICYLSEKPCSTCNVCPEYPAKKSIPLNEWCIRAAALPAPPPTGPGQPLKLDEATVCALICAP